MTLTTLDRPATKVRYYARYWENDDTANPVIVRYVSREGDYFNVLLPDGSERQVHLHTVTVFRRN